jgi:hypothetical protein
MAPEGNKGAVDRLDEHQGATSGSKVVATGGVDSPKGWSWREESNLQPAVYKTAALPIELRQPALIIIQLGYHCKRGFLRVGEIVGEFFRDSLHGLGLMSWA